MFTEPSAEGYRELLAGVRLKTIAHGERTLMGVFRIDHGAVIPEHDHPQEQTGYLVSGRLEFVIEGCPRVVEPGAGWNFPAGTPHGATAVEDCVVVEVFCPVREDYLP